MVGTARFELEPFCGREPAGEILSVVGEGSQVEQWSGRRDLNLSCFAGVSEAGAPQAKS
jgi:hypothetical protein